MQLQPAKVLMTRLIEGKENAKYTKKSSAEDRENQIQSEIDLVKIYENRNKHLDLELARLKTELDKAKTLLVQAEKQWQISLSNNRQNLNDPTFNNYEVNACPKSNYMVKVMNYFS